MKVMTVMQLLSFTGGLCTVSADPCGISDSGDMQSGWQARILL